MPAQLSLFGRSLVPSKIEQLFDHFAAVYPPRRGSDPRKPALEKFALLIERDHVDPQDIIAGARRYAESQPSPEFTCQMTTFLNQHRWEQENYGDRSLVVINGAQKGTSNGFNGSHIAGRATTDDAILAAARGRADRIRERQKREWEGPYRNLAGPTGSDSE